MQHYQVLNRLAVELECTRLMTNATIRHMQDFSTSSLCLEGEKWQTSPSSSEACPLNTARYRQRVIFPTDIAVTNLHPDLVLWSFFCQRASYGSSLFLGKMQWKKPSSNIPTMQPKPQSKAGKSKSAWLRLVAVALLPAALLS